MNADADVASEAFRIGASGYLLKNSHGEELLQAVRDVARGISYVTPQIRKEMEQRFIRDPKTLNRPKRLTDREREVLQLFAEGRPAKEMADILGISIRTVRFQKCQIIRLERACATRVSGDPPQLVQAVKPFQVFRVALFIEKRNVKIRLEHVPSVRLLDDLFLIDQIEVHL